MAGQVRRGEIPAPDDDDLADRYLLADEVLAAAGFEWYEVSNWARGADQRARHNEGYWLGHDWWGFGPGAHSHVGGTRWWNVRHPTAYAGRLAAGASPAHAREVLTDDQRRVEQRAARDPAARRAPARRPRAGRSGCRRPGGRRRAARPGRARGRPRSADAARPSAGRCRGARPGGLSQSRSGRPFASVV